MDLPVFGALDKKSTRALSDIFEVDYMPVTIAKALRVVTNNKRRPVASTLTKAEVRGGGRKPFRQKGTGNGRQGSTRNPQYVGGGVAFGPRGVENYSRSMPVKERRLALFSALSFLASEKKLGVVALPEASRLKDLLPVLESLPVSRGILVLQATGEQTSTLLGNLPGVEVVDVTNINPYLLLKSRYVYFTEQALGAFEKQYTVS